MGKHRGQLNWEPLETLEIPKNFMVYAKLINFRIISISFGKYKWKIRICRKTEKDPR